MRTRPAAAASAALLQPSNAARAPSIDRREVDGGCRWTASPPPVWRTKLGPGARAAWSAPRPARLGLRLAVWWRSVALDRALAEGRRPADDPRLELRVQQLAGARMRWILASGIRDVVARGERVPAPPALTSLTILPPSVVLRSPPAPLSAARAALLDLADALTDPGCTSIQGVARVSWMLCDRADSPLYDRIPAQAMRRIGREAVAALRGGRDVIDTGSR